ncbi:hypothetical protein [Paenibacillus sp. 1P07SE]|uniref:hypothetical protein n=1 Tax=Paenibacillus sp. 1P07SE TaxID=3132209 RepID=UPI0039A6D968
MYAQIFLGVWMLAIGVGHLFSAPFMIRQSYRERFSKEELASYQRGLVLPQFILGVTFISMGIVESKDLLSLPVFLGIYLLIVSFALGMILINNKKHTGYYFW